MEERTGEDGGARSRTVLAALDADAAAAPVLDAATAFAEMTGASVRVVHAGASGVDVVERLARGAGVPLQRLAGHPAPALVRALEGHEACAMAVGAGFTPTGWHPVGPTTRRVLERVTKPVLVVPNAAAPLRRIGRLLVPLEGTDASSRPVLEALCPLLAADVELVALHVFTERTLPRMLDRPCRDLELLGQEFLVHHLPQAARIDLRRGTVAAEVAMATETHRADVVVLAWSQRSSEGRAAVVRDVLGASSRPVLLLPVGAAAMRSPSWAGTARAAPPGPAPRVGATARP